MLEGGNARRCSVKSIIEASPCVRMKGVVRERKCAVLLLPIIAPTAKPYDSGSELENPCNFEYDGYNCSSLAHEPGGVERNKDFATRHPRMSVDCGISTDRGMSMNRIHLIEVNRHGSLLPQVSMSTTNPLFWCPFVLLSPLHRRRYRPLLSALVANV